MLANKLNVLLAERQLTIKEVVEDTGLSRNSISNISNNVKANISTETIDILCNYLGISPNEFFDYAPLMLNLAFSKNEYDCFIEVKTKQKRKEYNYAYKFISKNKDDPEINEQRNKNYDIYIDVYTDENPDSFLNIYRTLPVGFQTDINKAFIETIEKALNSDIRDNLKVLTFDYNSKNTSFMDLVKSINKAKMSLSITLPWIDITKELNFKNNIFIIK
ncbi:helix-turn-helix domain-containing protein [Companilactobacillus kedongensis]|uniref:helix-turn-helix domain-containing protein n=1 Tax=Companilactobacillus kedongensis TaxID=2486004 RepID=UPI0013DE5EBE|nr:helix-turn-helix transcriptional regulator [Companilactobacillus kedongensis]